MTALHHRGVGADSTGAALARVQAALREAGAVQKSDTEWSCPAKDNHRHGDQHPSLTVKYGDEDTARSKVLIHCSQCGGVKEGVLLPLLGLSPADLVDQAQAPQPRGKQVDTKIHVYEDELGDPLFRVVKRYYANQRRPDVVQQRPNGRGGWAKTRKQRPERDGKSLMHGVPRPLFRLPQVVAAVAAGQTIHLAEGESDADALNDWFTAHGEAAFATCHPEGARKWLPEHTATLAGAARVVVWADRDGPGYACAHLRLSAVREAGLKASARQPATGKDVRDHLNAGLAPEAGEKLKRGELGELAAGPGAAAEDVRDEAADDVLAAVQAEFLSSHDGGSDHLADLMDDDGLGALPPVDWAIDRWVPRGIYSVVYGPPGVGKTLALVGMALAVRRGSRWQNWKTAQGGVLFYQGEGLQQLAPRVAAWKARYPLRDDQRMAPGRYREAIFDLTKPESVAAVIRTVRALEAQAGEPYRMVVIDPLVEFMTGEENGEGMQLAARGLRALARLLDCAVVVGHHTNAAGERERGAAFLRMRAGTVMKLDRPDEGSELALVQDKNRFDEKQAIELAMRPSAASVVLEWTELALAEDHAAQQKAAQARRKTEAKQRTQDEKAEAARKRALDVVGAHPGISKTQAFEKAGGNRQDFYTALDTLVQNGLMRRETGARSSMNHWLVDGAGP